MKPNALPNVSRRELLRAGVVAVGAAWALAAGPGDETSEAAPDPEQVPQATHAFIRRCAREDGGYAPSPDAAYPGYSDTSLSDLAAVTYAATLAKTMGWRLPRRERSIDFIHGHQQADGSYSSRGGRWDPNSDLAVLYSTVQ